MADLEAVEVLNELEEIPEVSSTVLLIQALIKPVGQKIEPQIALAWNTLHAASLRSAIRNYTNN